MAAVWTVPAPTLILEQGRRQWWYEISGATVDIVDSLTIDINAQNIPQVCTMAYFKCSSNGTALLRPLLGRSSTTDPNSMELEAETDTAVTKVDNQAPYKMVLEGGKLLIYPNANANSLSMRISFVIIEGHGEL